MALSYNTYTGDSATQNFSVSFDYISQTHVKVYLDGVLQTVTADYTWFNATTIQFVSAPATDVVIRIERETPNTSRLVDFQDAGNLTEADLDTNSNQMFYLAQEVVDGFDDEAMKLATDNKWDAESHIIKNLADPVNDQDAATKLWSITAGNTALASALVAQAAAEAAQTAAELAETNAAASETATGLDAAATAADAVSTGLDAAATAADAIATAADAVSTAADALSTDADATATAADAIATAADAVSTAADVISCDADATAADASATAAAASAASVDSSLMRNRKNVIINGCMRVWQREETFAAAAHGAITADRWEYVNTSSAVATVYRIYSLSDDHPFVDALSLQPTTADASVAAGDSGGYVYKVEGPDVADWGFGYTNSNSFTLSFWHKHTKTGTHCVSFRNSANNRSYVAEYTQAGSNIWQQSTITVPVDTGGSWLKDVGDVGLKVHFTHMAGSTYQTTAGSWGAGNYLATSNQVNDYDNTSNQFVLGQVQLTREEVDTEFERRSFAEELDMCERYYETSYDYGIYPGAVHNNGIEAAYLAGLTTSVKYYGSSVPFRQKKAVTPTITTYSNVNGTSGKAYDYTGSVDLTTTISAQGDNGFKWNVTTGSAGNINLGMHWEAEAKL